MVEEELNGFEIGVYGQINFGPIFSWPKNWWGGGGGGMSTNILGHMAMSMYGLVFGHRSLFANKVPHICYPI